MTPASPSRPPWDVTGKVVLVTGASSGLGAHFARTLAGAGASVVVAARRVDRLSALCEELETAGGEVAPVRLDVTDPESIAAAVERVGASFGPIDVLVNNAGVGLSSRFVDTTVDQWNEVIGTNLLGVANVARAVVTSMMAAERPGSIINIASIMGLRTGPAASAYGSSKAAVMHLTRGMALELARYRIRVNAIVPGFFATELMEQTQDPTWLGALERGIPQRRIGQLVDLDGPLLLLASEASSYMTGSMLVVDGGHSSNSL